MKNKFQHIFRVAVCLVLVCCLTVNISPVRADATGAEAAPIFVVAPVPAKLAIATAVVGLGVMAGVSTDALDGVVDGCVGSTAMGQYILDEVIDAVKYTDPDGNVRWLFPLGFLETLRNILYADDVISDPSGTFQLDFSVDGTSYSFVNTFPVDVAHLYFTYYSSSSEPSRLIQDIVVSSGSTSRTVYYYVDGSSSKSSISHSKFSIVSSGFKTASLRSSGGGTVGSSLWDVSGIPSVYLGQFSTADDGYAVLDSYIFDVLFSVTALDLTLGNTGISSQSFSTAHSSWASSAVTVPGTYTPSGEDEDYIPVGIPGNYDSALNTTQEDVQSGVSVFTGIVFEEEETTPSTDSTNPDDTVVGAGAVTATLLERLFGGVQEKLDLTYISIQEIPELLREFMADVKTGFEELPTKFAEWFSSIQTALDKLVSGQLTIGQLLSDFLSPLVDAFKTLFQSLFVPSQDFVQTKVEIMLANFPFIGSIIETGTYIRDSLFASGPPVIYVDLSAADGDIDYGEKTLLTDFSWYAPYKSTVDSVLGAALWAFFGWRVFLRLPGLISGAEGYVGEFRTRYDAYSKKRKED